MRLWKLNTEIGPCALCLKRRPTFEKQRIESNRIESNRIYSRNATEVNGLWKKGILYSRREVKYECLPTIPLLRRLITRGLLPFLAAFASDGPGIEKA